MSLPEHANATGLVLPESTTFEEWMDIGRRLKSAERSLMWWIGDWLNFGERHYGEMYTQALEVTDFAYQTLRNAKWVAHTIQLSRRKDNLPWSAHFEVARLPALVQQDQALRDAAANGWTRERIRAEVYRMRNHIGASLAPGETCTSDDLKALLSAGVVFGTIYADPPWLYGNQATRSATGRHYEGMSVSEIAALPIAGLTAANAHLHLWTTNAFLFDAKAVIEAWGFEYKSCFVWVKPTIGIGNYWRVSHEFLLFAVRGSAPFADHSLRSWAEYERGSHSAKPEQVRALIERASPGPRLELFGRSLAYGWTVWGNSIERNLFSDMARQIA